MRPALPAAASAIAITLSEAITHTTAPAWPATARSSRRISPAERTAAIARFMALDIEKVCRRAPTTSLIGARAGAP